MKIMLIDRDRDVVDEVERICREIGDVDLTIEPIKNNAIETARAENFDAIFFDPAPKNEEMRALMIGVRRGNSSYTPVIIMSHQLSLDEARAVGANDYIQKQFDGDAFKKKLQNLKKLGEFNAVLHDETIDFPSRDGVISKSAFNQIFISCLDRADRYGEETYLTFATVKNIDFIRAEHGDDIANDICENLKKYTMRIRRLSDIAGRTAENQICLMLTRPANADEPKMAISRFADSMSEYAELISTSDVKAIINVEMMAIPSGEVTYSKDFE